ncbi:MAG TPA: T9SS type A sorting domain-containing protein [Bacteroidia bacterium]|nr:T9SS type A sorting domain-containing protein [Bacteroidia bacterium]
MKKILPFFFLISATFAGRGQNLVPNGSFDQYTGCPDGEGQIDSAMFWMNPAVYISGGGSPDYFNQCATNNDFGVPANYFGFQNAHSGDAYCGLVGWGLLGSPDWREYIEVALTSTLAANQCYHLEMYLSLADDSRYTSDAIGAYFSDTVISGIMNNDPLPYAPQIDINLGLSTDTSNWILITGNFTANGGENYMIIGNYKNDFQTNSLQLPAGSIDYSYFYIDDVSLTPCTGIEEQNENAEIQIYPNPVKDELFIKSNSLVGKAEIIITDILGKEILMKQFSNSKYQIPKQFENWNLNIENFKPGIYFIEINMASLPDRQGKNIFRKKFLKQ